MSSSTLIRLEFPLTPAGLTEASRDLERIRELVDAQVKHPPRAYAKHPARRVFLRSVGPRSREVLRLLPSGKVAALTPEQLAKRMAPGPGGQRLSRASVRAAIRNLQRCESHLLQEGAVDRRIVQIDFSSYERDGAGHYYVEPDDRRVLDRCFDKESDASE